MPLLCLAFFFLFVCFFPFFWLGFDEYQGQTWAYHCAIVSWNNGPSKSMSGVGDRVLPAG